MQNDFQKMMLLADILVSEANSLKNRITEVEDAEKKIMELIRKVMLTK